MAGSMLAPVGTEFGPCEDEPCGHVDCEATRAMAGSTCRLCSEPIGFDRGFYTDPEEPDALVHAVCLEESVA